MTNFKCGLHVLEAGSTAVLSVPTAATSHDRSLHSARPSVFRLESVTSMPVWFLYIIIYCCCFFTIYFAHSDIMFQFEKRRFGGTLSDGIKPNLNLARKNVQV